MKYVIEIPDALTHTALGTILAVHQSIVESLGPTVNVSNLVLGMTHQMGMVAALHMAALDPDDPENHTRELYEHLLGLVGLGMIYIKALTATPEEPENEPANG